MAVSLNRFVVTATTTVPAGTAATPVAGEPGTGGAAGYGNASLAATGGALLFAETFLAGQVIVLDSGTPSQLYSYLNGLGVLRAYVPGQDDVGHQGLAN